MADFLHKRGWAILAAGYRTRFGEIDLIASDRHYLAFVEVKLRRDDSFAPARVFVDSRKQNRLRMTAELYLAQNPTNLQPRFDVAEVYAPDGLKTKKPQIHYIEDAF